MPDTDPPVPDTAYAVVLNTGFSFGLGGGTSRVVATLSLYGDQPHGQLKTNQGRKVGVLVEDDIPTVLRAFAKLYEQEGSLHEVAEMFRGMDRGRG